ncbi:MAG: hypothetical protein AAFV62_13210, partial [Pseudomonadota bacterium]
MVDTVPGDISTTFTISVGTEVFGRIDFDGDEDWYRAELIAGRTYRMTLLEDGGDGASPIDLDLNDAAGNFLASNHSGDGSDAVLYFTPTVSGTYYLDAGSHQESVGDYRLLLEEIPGDSIAGDALTTATLGLDSNEGGILEFANDVDWYRVEAMAGESYFVSLIGLELKHAVGVVETEEWLPQRARVLPDQADEIALPGHRLDTVPVDIVGEL